MTDLPPNVVSLFSKKSAREEAQAKEVAKAVIIKASPNVDQRSMATLNSVMEAVAKGEAHAVCVIATGPTGLGRYWISFPAGAEPQAQAVRNLGLLTLYEDILKDIARSGIEFDDEPDSAA